MMCEFTAYSRREDGGMSARASVGSKRPAPGGSHGGSAAGKVRGPPHPTEPTKTAQIMSAWAHGFLHKRAQCASSKKLGVESNFSCPHYSLITVRADSLPPSLHSLR